MKSSMQAGYSSHFSKFAKDNTSTIIEMLKGYLPDAGENQIRAWFESIEILKDTVKEILRLIPETADKASIILEYTIPLETRRIDVVLLLGDCIFVIEFKGKSITTQADIDQASAYSRDLMAYHKECENRSVKCVLLLTQLKNEINHHDLVDVLGPKDLLGYLLNKVKTNNSPKLENFLSFESYQPLPSLIKAARELFDSGSLTRVHRAAMATEPTLASCTDIVKQTANKNRRALILISGIPGAGKTLVGLQLAHAKYLDDLAITRDDGEKPTAPAVYLSGNGPLVEVLQYELKSAGGGGKAFVRGVFDYVRNFTRSKNVIPPHHVLIYDEAQRAFDAEQVEAKHRNLAQGYKGLSEPDLFIQFAERIPEWSVVVGLIGSGQEIHIGEEAGIGQWKTAIENSKYSNIWDVYHPINNEIKGSFSSLENVYLKKDLELSTTIRFHLATQLYEFVEFVLEGQADHAKEISLGLEKQGYHLRMTHRLDNAKQYLLQRYSENPDARYGLIASSKDKSLEDHGIPKGYKSSGEVSPGQYGRWYVEGKGNPGSCTSFEKVATEFGSQGLELDACLLAWGTDFIRESGEWTNKYSRRYRDSHRIKNALVLRKNAYRVLLTRGRDCCVVFIPPIKDKTRETYEFLRSCGFRELS